jgi:hypothetical protein
MGLNYAKTDELSRNRCEALVFGWYLLSSQQSVGIAAGFTGRQAGQPLQSTRWGSAQQQLHSTSEKMLN